MSHLLTTNHFDRSEFFMIDAEGIIRQQILYDFYLVSSFLIVIKHKRHRIPIYLTKIRCRYIQIGGSLNHKKIGVIIIIKIWIITYFKLNSPIWFRLKKKITLSSFNYNFVTINYAVTEIIIWLP